MDIITTDNKNKQNNRLKNYVNSIYVKLANNFTNRLVTATDHLICSKCHNFKTKKSICNFCGYKPLSKREVQQNTKFLSKNFARIDSENYEAQELNSQLAYVSDIGQSHHENQDSGLVGSLEHWNFLGVSDGVSRSNAPKIASQYALEKSFEYLQNIPLNLDNVKEEISNAILYAHNQIQQIVLESFNPEVDPPEATIVIALVQNNKAFIGWVGDSRAYTIDNNKSQILTRDDSWVMYALDKGMSFKDASGSPMAHAITQCMGMQDIALIPHIVEVDITNKDLLLCSDGLWNYFDDENLLHSLYQKVSGSAKEIANKLVKAANIKGGDDNITVAIYKNENLCTS